MAVGIISRRTQRARVPLEGQETSARAHDILKKPRNSSSKSQSGWHDDVDRAKPLSQVPS